MLNEVTHILLTLELPSTRIPLFFLSQRTVELVLFFGSPIRYYRKRQLCDLITSSNFHSWIPVFFKKFISSLEREINREDSRKLVS